MDNKISRGKRIDNGKWIEGKLVITYFPTMTECTIFDTLVEPKTIGHFSRKVDKNGNKIFSGDIVTYKDENHEILTDDGIDFCMRGIETTCKIGFKNGIGLELLFGKEYNLSEIEVIGNIHEIG